MLFITGMALCQALRSHRSRCDPLPPLPQALGFYGESGGLSGDRGTCAPERKTRMLTWKYTIQ